MMRGDTGKLTCVVLGLGGCLKLMWSEKELSLVHNGLSMCTE